MSRRIPVVCACGVDASETSAISAGPKRRMIPPPSRLARGRDRRTAGLASASVIPQRALSQQSTDGGADAFDEDVALVERHPGGGDRLANPDAHTYWPDD